MQALQDRHTAGLLLADIIKSKNLKDACILALPKGGVPVAAEIAKCLDLPWDLAIVKKISSPGQTEFAVGAMTEDHVASWDQESIASLQISEQKQKDLAEKTYQKILQQVSKWQNLRTPLRINGRTVILVDDGLATGLTMRAAVDFVERQGAASVIVACPVASKQAVARLEKIVDEVIYLMAPETFFSVGQWYKDFEQVSDAEVEKALKGDGLEVPISEEVRIGTNHLQGILSVPKNVKGAILFAHGSGSSHKSPRNKSVAKALQELGFATLVFDLLTPEESKERTNIFDIDLLSERLLEATRWLRKEERLQHLPMAYFGASTGAAAALVAAAKDESILSVVSRGGRPDLASDYLGDVSCPVLLIVGSWDYGVIELNEKANSLLEKGEIVVIPKAGHLFEEEGALDRVIDYAGDWFTKTLDQEREPVLLPKELVIKDLTELALPLKSPANLQPLLEKMSKYQVVMLGEATHGTEDFYEWRKLISQKLLEDYGFKFIAVEGDWPDSYKLHQYIQMRRSEKSAKDIMQSFTRWPTWMWANEQVADMVEWMRGRGYGFYGLDVYSLFESLRVIKDHLKKVDSTFKDELLERYECFDYFGGNEVELTKSIVQWPEACQKEVLENLRQILRLRLEDTKLHEYELFDMQQNAKIIHNAERYYRSMIEGGPESWNIRDEHMMDTLDSLMRYYAKPDPKSDRREGEGAKAIVWAHNTHIGDYHATDMLDGGYINLGGLARERYGLEKVFLVGFGTYDGEVLAGKAWDAKAEVMRIPPAQPGTYEDYFHRVAKKIDSPSFYVFLDGKKSLRLEKGHRAIGVVYQPRDESRGLNYSPTKLAERYNAFVFIDSTRSLKMVPTKAKTNVLPETWPSGV